jgi:hypothetical protein
MNRNPDISSIRVDEGYTKANKLKLGLVRSWSFCQTNRPAFAGRFYFT